MATLTNITTEPLELLLAHGEYQRLIEPGESADISDYILTGYVWPAVTWRIDGTDVVTLQGDAYQAPPEQPTEQATPAVSESE